MSFDRSASPLRGFLEIAYATNDLDRAMAMFASDYGIAGWLETGPVSIAFGPGRTGRLKIAILGFGDALIELIEPVDGDIDWFRAVLPPEGFAVRLHHLGFGCASPDALGALREQFAEDHVIAAEGPFGTTSHYFFVDTRAEFGHYLEYIFFGEEFAAAIPRAVVTDESAAERLAGLAQTAYITSDYDRALALLRSRYRIARFQETGRVTVPAGPGKQATLQVAQAYVDTIQIEVIGLISGDDSVYRDVLDATPGPIMTFHHLSFASPDRRDLERKREAAIGRGDLPVLEGEYGGDSAYFYVDARETLGHHLEYAYAEAEFDRLIPRQ